MKDLHNNITVARAISPVSVSDTTAQVSQIIDLQGYHGLEFEQSVIEGGQRNFSNIRARLAALTVVDADGNRLFNDDDVETLGRKSAAALDRIFTVAQRLNGLRNADVEELVGNSEAGPTAGSPTA